MEKPISYRTKKGGKMIYPLYDTKGKFLEYASLKVIQKLKPLCVTPNGGFTIKTK